MINQRFIWTSLVINLAKLDSRYSYLFGLRERYVNETNRTRSLSRDKNFEKNTKTPFFSPNRKTCVFFVRFLCATREMSQKIQGKWVTRTRDQSILNEYPNDWDTNDLRKKRKFRRTLYLLTNKNESVVLGSFTFESSTTNLRHMLGLYVSLRNTRKKLPFLPGHKERVLSVSFTYIHWYNSLLEKLTINLILSMMDKIIKEWLPITDMQLELMLPIKSTEILLSRNNCCRSNSCFFVRVASLTPLFHKKAKIMTHMVEYDVTNRDLFLSWRELVPNS